MLGVNLGGPAVDIVLLLQQVFGRLEDLQSEVAKSKTTHKVAIAHEEEEHRHEKDAFVAVEIDAPVPLKPPTLTRTTVTMTLTTNEVTQTLYWKRIMTSNALLRLQPFFSLKGHH